MSDQPWHPAGLLGQSEAFPPDAGALASSLLSPALGGWTCCLFMCVSVASLRTGLSTVAYTQEVPREYLLIDGNKLLSCLAFSFSCHQVALLPRPSPLMRYEEGEGEIL